MTFELDVSGEPKHSTLRVSSCLLDIPSASASIGGAYFPKMAAWQPLSDVGVAGMISTPFVLDASTSKVGVGSEIIFASAVVDDVELNDVVEIVLSDADWDFLSTFEGRAPAVNATLRGFLKKPSILEAVIVGLRERLCPSHQANLVRSNRFGKIISAKVLLAESRR